MRMNYLDYLSQGPQGSFLATSCIYIFYHSVLLWYVCIFCPIWSISYIIDQKDNQLMNLISGKSQVILYVSFLDDSFIDTKLNIDYSNYLKPVTQSSNCARDSLSQNNIISNEYHILINFLISIADIQQAHIFKWDTDLSSIEFYFNKCKHTYYQLKLFMNMYFLIGLAY